MRKYTLLKHVAVQTDWCTWCEHGASEDKKSFVTEASKKYFMSPRSIRAILNKDLSNEIAKQSEQIITNQMTMF